MTCTTVRPAFVLFILSITFVASPARAGARAADEAQQRCDRLPANIHVDPFLQPVVRDLLRKSPTFQRQCHAIAARTTVRVSIVAVWNRRESSQTRARASIARYQYGFVRATIEVPMVGPHAELIPHEFEHVLEQIEGVDLEAMAREGRGANAVSPGVYETARARAAGLAAADEVYAYTPEPAVAAAKALSSGLWRAVRQPARTQQRRIR